MKKLTAELFQRKTYKTLLSLEGGAAVFANADGSKIKLSTQGRQIIARDMSSGWELVIPDTIRKALHQAEFREELTVSAPTVHFKAVKDKIKWRVMWYDGSKTLATGDINWHRMSSPALAKMAVEERENSPVPEAKEAGAWMNMVEEQCKTAHTQVFRRYGHITHPSQVRDYLEEQFAMLRQKQMKKAVTVIEAMESYEISSASTQADMNRAIELVRAFIGDIPAEEFNKDTASRFASWLVKEYNYSNNSVKARLKAVRKAIAPHCETIWSVNDAMGRMKTFDGKKAALFLSGEELKAALALDDSFLPPKQRICWKKFLFCCLTGDRSSEVNTLYWNNIREGYAITYNVVKTKQIIRKDIPSEAWKLLNSAYILGGHREKVPVFGLSGASYCNTAITKALAEIDLPSLDIQHQVITGRGLDAEIASGPKREMIKGHDARGTFINSKLEEGWKLIDISRYLGVALSTIEKFYSHIKSYQYGQ